MIFTVLFDICNTSFFYFYFISTFKKFDILKKEEKKEYLLLSLSFSLYFLSFFFFKIEKKVDNVNITLSFKELSEHFQIYAVWIFWVKL